MRDVMKVLKAKYFIGVVSWFLFHDNWHVREESLRALIVCSIETNDSNFEDVDYLSLVEALGICMVDKVPKVRYVAMECIACFCKYAHWKRVLELLYEMINKPNYLAICDRLDHGLLPYIAEGGWVEFPYLFSEEFK